MKTDIGMICGRGKLANSDGVLLQNKLSGNSQDGQDDQGDPPDRSEMRSFGPDRSLTSRAVGQDYVSSKQTPSNNCGSNMGL